MLKNGEKMRDAIIKTPCMSQDSSNHCFLLSPLQDAPEGKPSHIQEPEKRLIMASRPTKPQRLNVTVYESKI